MLSCVMALSIRNISRPERRPEKPSLIWNTAGQNGWEKSSFLSDRHSSLFSRPRKGAFAGIIPKLFRHLGGLPLPPDLKSNLRIPKPGIYTFRIIPLSSNNHGGIIRSILLFTFRVIPFGTAIFFFGKVHFSPRTPNITRWGERASGAAIFFCRNSPPKIVPKSSGLPDRGSYIEGVSPNSKRILK